MGYWVVDILFCILFITFQLSKIEKMDTYCHNHVTFIIVIMRERERVGVREGVEWANSKG